MNKNMASISVLLIMILVFPGSLGAVPFFQNAGPEYAVSKPWPHKRLAGVVSSPLGGPPDYMTEEQQGEWWLGVVVGYANLCGDYGIANKVKAILKRSPHFNLGFSAMSEYDLTRNCGDHMEILERVLSQKSAWESHLNKRFSSPSSDMAVCNFAVTLKDKNFVWEDRKTYQAQVAEAKRRGLTLNSCASLLGK